MRLRYSITKISTVFALVVLMFLAGAASAQVAQPDNNVEQPAVQVISTVTASATAERVRFTSPNTVVQLRLEVYDEAGQKLLDTEQRGGNVLDWHLQGGAGERVSDGVYLCVLTSKNLAGRLNQKLGLVTVSGQSTVVRSAAVAELSLRQAQTVGPIEIGEAGLTVMGAEDTPPVTVLANSGNEAQLARTRGALTFRVGDFFSGADKEQMRLTEDGNLGIGTTKPKVKLDVAGIIRAREGFLFANGSALNINDKGALTLTNSDGSVVPSAAGTGTLNQVAKWMETGGAGTLGNSTITELNGNVGIGTPSPSGQLHIFGTATQDVFAGMGPDLAVGPAFNFGYAGGSFGRGAGFFNVRPDGGATAPNPSLRFATANVERMIVTNIGRVGIGTTTPGNKLDVAGDVNTSTQYNIGGNRILSNAGTQNLFAGVGAGQNDVPLQGVRNSFFGNNAGQSNTAGTDNSFFGSYAGQANTDSPANSFFGTLAGQQTTGCCNSFFGYDAGDGNKAGLANAFFGDSAGITNVNGDYNTAIGGLADVGSPNLDHATAIGAGAVVSTSNTIALGRADGSDIVDVPGK
jgi:hypothetical protein